MSDVSATTSITLEYTGANERDTVIVIIVFFCQTHCCACCFGQLKSSLLFSIKDKKVRRVKKKKHRILSIISQSVGQAQTHTSTTEWDKYIKTSKSPVTHSICG